jgi:ketosteroid isomerase-like protein
LLHITEADEKMALDLPEPLSRYFAAANTDDAGRIAACFAENATVHDEKRDFAGRAAIRQWAADARAKYRFQSEPFKIEGESNRPVVTAHLTGDFPGSPIDLTYRFEIVDGAIAALSIG